MAKRPAPKRPVCATLSFKSCGSDLAYLDPDGRTGVRIAYDILVSSFLERLQIEIKPGREYELSIVLVEDPT